MHGKIYDIPDEEFHDVPPPGEVPPEMIDISILRYDYGDADAPVPSPRASADAPAPGAHSSSRAPEGRGSPGNTDDPATK